MSKAERKKVDDNDPDYKDPDEGKGKGRSRSHKRKSTPEDIYLPRTGWKKWTDFNLPDLVRDQDTFSQWLEECGVKYHKQEPEECDPPGMTPFFGGSRLTTDIIVLLTHGLVHNRSTGQLMSDLGLDYSTVVNWRSYVRQVMLDWALNNQDEDQIGGPGKIVEIDVSKFGKRKYHRGEPVEGEWVFGGIERESSKMFLVAVGTWDRDTLLPIIKKHIKPGTTIMSDSWKASDTLEEDDLKQLNINNSNWYMEPFTGAANRNTIEGRWRQVKGFIHQYSQKKGHNAGYLAHYMFYKHCFVEQKDPLEFFLGLTSYCEFKGGVIEEDSDSEIYEDEKEYVW